MHLMKGEYDLEIDCKAVEDNNSYKQLQESHGESGQLFRSLERVSFPVLGKLQFTVKLKISIRTKVSVATRQDSIIRDFLVA